MRLLRGGRLDIKHKFFWQTEGGFLSNSKDKSKAEFSTEMMKGKSYLLINDLVNLSSILETHVNNAADVSSGSHYNDIAPPSSNNSIVERQTAVVLAEYKKRMLLAIAANSEGGVVDKGLGFTVFKKTFYPGVSTRGMYTSCATLRCYLSLYEFPAWTVVLSIKTCTHPNGFVLESVKAMLQHLGIDVHCEKVVVVDHGAKALAAQILVSSSESESARESASASCKGEYWVYLKWWH